MFPFILNSGLNTLDAAFFKTMLLARVPAWNNHRLVPYKLSI